MSVRFAKCIAYGVRTHNADIDTTYSRTWPRGERPKYVDIYDLAVLACRPFGDTIQQPLAFTASYLQAYLGAINLLRCYLRYNQEFNMELIHWTTDQRSDIGLTAKEYIRQQVSRAYASQASGGLQLIESCLALSWSQLSVESGYSRECARKSEALNQWEDTITEVLREDPAVRPDALLAGDNRFPPNLERHPQWAYSSDRSVLESQQTTQASHIPQGPQHPSADSSFDAWGGNPWGSDAVPVEPMPKATPSWTQTSKN